jgi:uncharacterized protein (TIGR01440 family)
MEDEFKAWDGKAITAAVESILTELVHLGSVAPGQIIVIGTSTSEVIGKRMGTGGSADAAEAIFEGVRRVREQAGFYPVFQCCEHLNRALVLEKELLKRYPDLEPVSAIPIPGAGGSMASHAYRNLPDPVLVESIKAHAGIDIGGTLIGMHLRQVAVPVRPSIRTIGSANVSMAFTRPKLIGGARAVYDAETAGVSRHCD